MRKIVFALVLLLPVSVYAKGSQTSWPDEREKGSYQAKIASTGKILWQVHWETAVKQEDGRAKVEVREQGNGRPWHSKEPVVWQKKMLFQEGPVLEMQSMSSSKWSEAGQSLEEIEFEADPALRRIRYTNSEAGKRPESAVLPWTPQSIPDEMLFHWARTLPFEKAVLGGQPSAECTLVLSPRQQVRIKAQVRGIERVTTPAGTFSCYRVELVPQLFGPLKALAPRMSLWCRTQSPNIWVRYQGPVGGPGSPEAVIELVQFDQGDKAQ